MDVKPMSETVVETEHTPGDLEARVRKMAHSLPPSDIGSTRSIQAITAFVTAEQRDLVEALYAIEIQFPYSDAVLQDVADGKREMPNVSKHWAQKILAARAALSKAKGGTNG